MSTPVQAVLTDIEGTTSSISFVHEVLFPYAREALPAYVAEHGGEPEVAALLDQVRVEAGAPQLDEQGVIDQLLAWIDEDRKAPPLKALQGLIWVEGYTSGAYRGHVYDDAVAGLRRWRAAGLELAVYSSGSVLAQKLIFGNSVAGDLTPLFASYFDTSSGHKREVGSYRVIAAAMGRPPGEVLFLSDVVEELDAAAEAGMQTAWLVREGALPSSPAHPVHRDFSTILD